MGLDEKIKIRQMRELNNRKGIFLDLTYIDMVKDINTAVLLSQLVYWFSSDVHGKTKLRVVKEGKLWLVKSKNEWYLETRLSKKQLERAEKILKELGIIEIKTWKFKNIPTNHYYFKWDNFIQLEENILLKGINNIKKGKCIDTKSADITNFNGMNRNGSISSFGMTQKVASLRNDPKGSNGDEPKGSIPWDDPKGGNPITYNTQENTNTENRNIEEEKVISILSEPIKHINETLKGALPKISYETWINRSIDKWTIKGEELIIPCLPSEKSIYESAIMHRIKPYIDYNIKFISEDS